jgi:hypothetical protein
MRHTFGVVISIMCVDVLAIGNCPMQFGNMVHSLFSDQEGQSISNNVFSELASLLQFVTLQLVVLCFYWNVQCIRACQLLLNCFPFFFQIEIGLGLTGFGVLFSFLGIIMLFDKGFLAMGNVRIIHPVDGFCLHSVSRLLISTVVCHAARFSSFLASYWPLGWSQLCNSSPSLRITRSW